MKMEASQFKVFVNQDCTVSLSQEVMFEDPAIIAIHPSQVDLLCEWLQECKEAAIELQEEHEGDVCHESDQ